MRKRPFRIGRRIYLILSVFTMISMVAGCYSLRKNSSAREVTFKVMTYNIHHTNPPSQPGLISPEAIARVIREQNPDLVALQEVDVNNRRSGVNLNQAKVIAELLGMEYHFTKAIDYQGGYYGNAVLSKFPIKDRMDVEMPTLPTVDSEDRTWAGVKIRIEGRDIWFGSTHLDYKTEENNLHQSRILMDAVKKISDPVIIAGDFNAGEHSSTLEFFGQEFRTTCPGDCPPTFPEDQPRNAIDFIIYRPQDYFEVLSHQVIDEQYASDHRPVVAELKFRARK